MKEVDMTMSEARGDGDPFFFAAAALRRNRDRRGHLRDHHGRDPQLPGEVETVDIMLSIEPPRN